MQLDKDTDRVHDLTYDSEVVLDFLNHDNLFLVSIMALVNLKLDFRRTDSGSAWRSPTETFRQCLTRYGARFHDSLRTSKKLQ